jgi:hypothetical protein
LLASSWWPGWVIESNLDLDSRKVNNWIINEFCDMGFYGKYPKKI